MRIPEADTDSADIGNRRRKGPYPALSLCVLWWLTVAGCQAADDERQRRADERELDLAALGYLDWSPADPDSSTGVVRNEISSQGYNLYNTRSLGRAELIDMDGCVLATWQDTGGATWSRTRLLDGGDLIVIGAESHSTSERKLTTDLSGLFLMRLTFDGDLLWKKEYPAHHDVAPIDAQRLLVLTQSWRQLETRYGDIPVRDNGIAVLSADGEELERLSLYDVLSSDGFPFREVPKRLPSGNPGIDLLHANSVVAMTKDEKTSGNGLYGPNHVLVTLREQNAIVILDRARRRLIWHWGPGELLGPHNATPLASGNLLIFDNRRGEGASRVVELDPARGEIVWLYEAPDPRDFYTASRGAAQRLANGNTLITQSDSGRAFEITAEGQIVWEMLNSHRNDRDQRAIFGRVERISRQVVRRLYEGPPIRPRPECPAP